jgi:signal transduction histidine kinase
LLYPIAGAGLVGPDGSPGEPPTAPDPGLTPIRRGSVTVAYIAHQRKPLDVDGTILDDITSATQLMLDSERLRAEHSWHLRQLQQSRRRIVAAADAARRALERDLHDGAQQNLVSLAMALSVAQLRTSDPGDEHLLRRAGTEVSNALAELREIAHGIFPRELGDDGLEAALDLLAESAASPIAVTGAMNRRLPTAVESAAYFAVRTSLATHLDGTDGAATVSVRLSRPSDDPGSPEWLTVDIEIDATPSDLLAIEDRLGALGGRLTVRHEPAGTRLRVELPCAS